MVGFLPEAVGFAFGLPAGGDGEVDNIQKKIDWKTKIQVNKKAKIPSNSSTNAGASLRPRCLGGRKLACGFELVPKTRRLCLFLDDAEDALVLCRFFGGRPHDPKG